MRLHIILTLLRLLLFGIKPYYCNFAGTIFKSTVDFLLYYTSRFKLKVQIMFDCYILLKKHRRVV